MKLSSLALHQQFLSTESSQAVEPDVRTYPSKAIGVGTQIYRAGYVTGEQKAENVQQLPFEFIGTIPESPVVLGDSNAVFSVNVGSVRGSSWLDFVSPVASVESFLPKDSWSALSAMPDVVRVHGIQHATFMAVHSQAFQAGMAVPAVYAPFAVTRPASPSNLQEVVNIFDFLQATVRKLHASFSQWSSSYNRLLMIGSLDYCRSVLLQVKKKNLQGEQLVEAQQELTKYVNLCRSIYNQNKDGYSAFRLLDLQSVADRFELLQEHCATHDIYPKLEELNLAEIPFE